MPSLSADPELLEEPMPKSDASVGNNRRVWLRVDGLSTAPQRGSTYILIANVMTHSLNPETPSLYLVP